MDDTDRLQTEEALRASEAKWHTLFENAPVVILTADRAGTILTFNHSLLGRTPAEVVGRCIHDFALGDDDRRCSVEHLERVFATGRAEQFEVRTLAADGRVVHLRSVFAPVVSEGRVTSVVAVGMDVTAEAEATAALRHTSEQLGALSSNLADGMVYQISSGRDGRERRFSYLSPAVERFHGLTVDAVQRDPGLLYGQVVEEDRGLVAQAEAEAFAKRRKLEVEVRVRLPSGETRWRRFVSSPRTAPDGCVLWDGIEQDVTERKRLEEGLRESERRFRDIVESMGDWYWEMDAAGRLTASSEHSLRLLGRSPAEVIGHSPVEFAAPDDAARQRQYLAEHGTPSRPIRDFLGWYLHPDGRRVCIAVSGVPVLGPAGALAGWRGVARDVTGLRREEEERRAIEEKMQQAQKLESLGVLAGGIAHDFNNLLAVVLGNADLALAELSPDAAARESVEQIQKAGLHAAELTRQMLAYAGRGSTTLQRVSIREIVQDMAQLLGASISKRHALTLDLARDLPAVEADPGQMRQIVMNLLVNASEAIGQREGVIRVRAAALAPGGNLEGDIAIGDLGRARHVLLEVADTGEGMDAATLKRIFDPFFTTKFAGRGLGLAAVLGIVRRHGGALRVRSRPGQDSTFSVLLPAMEERGAPAGGSGAGAEPSPAWRGSGPVLLVDDEAALRDMGSRMLRAMGFDVVLAGDGAEALERLAAAGGRIRAVLLDLAMPRMDGEATLRAIRAVSPALPVVLCSGFDLVDRGERFAGLAVSGFLQKPFVLADLVRALRTALGE